MTRTSGWTLSHIIAGGLFLVLLPAGAIAGESFDATIINGGGQKTRVEDLHLVYSWREMPQAATGLIPYQMRNKIEQGIWVAHRGPGATGFEMIPFKNIETIEFSFSLKQIGLSDTYQFQVDDIWLKPAGGKRVSLGRSLLCEQDPVLWPTCQGAIFPGGADDKRMDRLTVMLQGKTKIDGRDSEYVFVFPRPADAAIRPVMQKKQDAFVRLIQLSRADQAR